MIWGVDHSDMSMIHYSDGYDVSIIQDVDHSSVSMIQGVDHSDMSMIQDTDGNDVSIIQDVYHSNVSMIQGVDHSDIRGHTLGAQCRGGGCAHQPDRPQHPL